MESLNAVPIDQPDKFREIVSTIAVEDKTNESNAFFYGVYYLAWHRMWLGLTFGYHDETKQHAAEKHAAFYFGRAMQLREKLKLSNEDVRRLSPYYVANEEKIFPELLKSRQFHGSYPLPAGLLGKKVK